MSDIFVLKDNTYQYHLFVKVLLIECVTQFNYKNKMIKSHIVSYHNVYLVFKKSTEVACKYPFLHIKTKYA